MQPEMQPGSRHLQGGRWGACLCTAPPHANTQARAQDAHAQTVEKGKRQRRQPDGSTGSQEGECEDGASSHLRLCAGRRRAARGGAAAVGIRSRVGVLLSGLVCRSPQGAAAGSSSRGDGCLHLLLLLDRRSRWLLVTWRWRSHCSSSYCRRSCWAETSSSSRAGQQRPSSSTLASRSAPSRASTGAAARRLGRPP